MGGKQVIHQCGLRVCHGSGISDFTGVVGTQFNHCKLMFFCQAQQCQRHADIIIKVTGGKQGFACLL